MYERLLLYVDQTEDSRAAANEALRIAAAMDARVFAAAVLDPALPGPPAEAGAPAALPRPRFRRRRKAEAGSETEEAAWRRLYEIEDDCFEKNVKSSLLLECGSRDERILALIESYELNALVVGARSVRPWEALIERCPVPVILVHQQDSAMKPQ